MGYYSAVGISIKEKDYQKLTKNIEKCLDFEGDTTNQETIKDVKRLMACCDANYKFIPDDDTKEVYHYFGWDYIKWYENHFAEVDYIMDFIHSLEDYNFIRLGEDTDDIHEEINSDLYTICVERSIEVCGKEIKEEDENNV